tara:strand:- start:1231 stop:1344 length:114 start_codon:yes stop_codon:yes gene_type:complete
MPQAAGLPAQALIAAGPLWHPAWVYVLEALPALDVAV